MRLKEFRIQNYRSINDSGWVNISKQTVFVGRNESGKSNLLRALHSLNPVAGVKALDKTKDLPRHQDQETFDDTVPVVASVWDLNEEEKTQLQGILSHKIPVTSVILKRTYEGTKNIEFPGIPNQEFKKEKVIEEIQAIISTIKTTIKNLDDSARSSFENIVSIFQKLSKSFDNSVSWAQAANSAISTLKTEYKNIAPAITSDQENSWWFIREMSNVIIDHEEKYKKANLWVEQNIPKFIFIDQYPQLGGYHNIRNYLERTKEEYNEEDKNFSKLYKIAELDPKKLQDLLESGQPEDRNQLVNRASALLTKEICRLWGDRLLKIRINVDAQYLRNI